MKKVLLIMVLFAISFIGKAQQTYDFSAVCETGQTLYYIITDGENREVKVTCPNYSWYVGLEMEYDEEYFYYGYEKPVGNLTIPSSVEQNGETYSVTAIDSCAFVACDGLAELTIPNTITAIFSYAFYHSGIKGELAIPQSVVSIENNTFYNCDGITSVLLPNSIRNIADRAFYSCAGLTHLAIPNSVQTIGKEAFAFCVGLTGHLVIPDSVTELGNGAFKNCLGITGVTLSNSLTEIPANAFYQCSALTGTFVVPEGVLLIGSRAFQETGIKELTLPTTLATISGHALYHCYHLKILNYNAIDCGMYSDQMSEAPNIETVNFGDAVQTIEGFKNCKHLISPLVFPNSLRTIKTEAFFNCTSLTGELVLPDSIQYIGSVAFADCSGLTGQLKLPKHLKEIGQEAFENCSGLTSVVMSDSLERIGAMAFNGCSNLSGVLVIPEEVNHIDNGVIHETNFSSIVVLATTPPYCQSEYCFVYQYDLPLFVPNGTKEIYEAHPYWGLFTNIIEMDDDIAFGSEWYYEILNDDGSITYQQLQQEGDTVVNHKDVKIIVRTNTLYDKHQEITHEYVYEENNVVYWWDNENQQFTVLYDLKADEGDEWEIKVGMNSIIMHVNAVTYRQYENKMYKVLMVSDESNIFSGSIVCGIGHMTSFFPEILMNGKKNYRIEGIRCCWMDGNLILKNGDKDCDAVYEEMHFGLDETPNAGFTLYPNPTSGTLYIENQGDACIFSISNMLGQTIMTGNVADSQTIDVSLLDDGMYFICVGQQTVKFVVRK